MPSYIKVIANLVQPVRSLGWFDEKDGEMTRIRKGSNTLVILLHGFASRPYDMRSLIPVIDKAYEKADIFVPGLPMHFFSFHDPLVLCRELLGEIDALYKENRYERVVLVGHSFGSLIARKVVVCAFGSSSEAPLEAVLESDQPREWGERIDRLILLAGMNRGWSISRHLSIPNIIVWRIGMVLGYFLAIFHWRPPLIFKVRGGANFITQLRLQWLALRQRQRPERASRTGTTTRSVMTIQLLGSVDDVVSPVDNVDLVAGSDFVYLDVPESGHLDILNMSLMKSDLNTWERLYNLLRKVLNKSPIERKEPFPIGETRAVTLRDALTKCRKEMEKSSVQPFDSTMDAPRDDKVGVVFVVHGIRDLGFWTSKIARRVVKEAREHEQDFATETSSYGYFAMLPFFLPWVRRQKVEWMMDRYAECRARYPQATFHFVGHSNGTYLLARALEEYPCARFERVVLAGSVIPTDFEWKRFIQKGQIGAVVNFVATSDWVLALFPKAFQRMDHVVRWVLRRRWLDLGAAGHDGFASGKELPDVFFVRGGHSAALREQFWESIAKFVVHGYPPPVIPKDFREKKLNRFWWFIGWIAPVPLVCIAGALIYVTYLLGTRHALLGINLDIEWLRTIVLVCWGWAVYRIVTWL